MHATTEQLLSCRDNELMDAKVKSHVQNCEHCLSELSHLSELGSIIQSMPVPELNEHQLQTSWGVVSNALAQQNKAEFRQFPYWSTVAASVFAIGLVLLFSIDKSVINEIPEQFVEFMPETDIEESIPVVTSNNESELAQLVAYSRLLEGRLQSMPQPRIVRANTAGTISQLEDQISIMDNRLNLDHQVPLTEEQRNALWQQRVNSMNNLYRVRSAQLQRVSY